MKNFFKFLGIISLALIIGFSMASCGDGDGGGGGGGGGTGTGGGGGTGGFWTTVSIEGVSGTLNSVASDGTMFIASTNSGSGKLLKSDDGTTWTVFHNGGALTGLGFSANKVSYAGDMFFAFDKKLAYSEDKGAIWQAVTNTTAYGAGFNDETINNVFSTVNGHFVAVRNGPYIPIIQSKDGKDWQNPSFSYNSGDFSQRDFIYDGAFGSNLVVFVGKNGRIYPLSSPSYDAWFNKSPAIPLTSKTSIFSKENNKELSFDLRDPIYGIAFAPVPFGNFVAVGAKGKIAYCEGLTWSDVKSPFDANTTIMDVAFGGGKFVAVGSGGKTATSSDGGKTWKLETNSSKADIYSIAYGSGRFVAVGNGWIGYSADTQ